MKKKILAMVIAVIMVVVMLPIVTITVVSIDVGGGTDAENATALRNALTSTTPNRVINLTSDIYISGNWTPIYLNNSGSGQNEGNYKFTLNGNGYVISLQVNETVSSGDGHAGLFAAVRDDHADITVKNLGIVSRGISVTSSANDTNINLYAGGLFGRIDTWKPNIIIENCFVRGNVTASTSGYSNAWTYTGGFIGHVNWEGSVTIRDSYFNGSATSRAEATGNFIIGKKNVHAFTGGLIGQEYFANVNIRNSYASGSVNSTAYAQGVLGGTEESFAGCLLGLGNASATNSYSANTVTPTIGRAGVGNGTSIGIRNNSEAPSWWNYHVTQVSVDTLRANPWQLGMSKPPNNNINNGFPVLRQFHYARGISLNNTNYTFANPLSATQNVVITLNRSLAGTWDKITLSGSNLSFDTITSDTNGIFSDNTITCSNTSSTSNTRSIVFRSTVKSSGTSTSSRSFTARTDGGRTATAWVYISNGVPAVTVKAEGLDNLKVNQAIPIEPRIIYTLSNSTYATSITPSNFAVGNLPPGFTQGTAVRTNSTTVTIPISGTPTVAGTYTITLPSTIPASNVLDVASSVTRSGTVTITVAKGDGAAVSGSPTILTKTHDSITINPVSISINPGYQTAEYAINTTATAPSSGWQSGTVFTELKCNTAYFVFARSTENTNFNAGQAMGVEVTTLLCGVCEDCEPPNTTDDPPGTTPETSEPPETTSETTSESTSETTSETAETSDTTTTAGTYTDITTDTTTAGTYTDTASETSQTSDTTESTTDTTSATTTTSETADTTPETSETTPPYYNELNVIVIDFDDDVKDEITAKTDMEEGETEVIFKDCEDCANDCEGHVIDDIGKVTVYIRRITSPVSSVEELFAGILGWFTG